MTSDLFMPMNALLLITSYWFAAVQSLESLEVNYNVLPSTFYRVNGSNVVYGQDDRLVLGCMLPLSASHSEAFEQRNNLMWAKDYEDEICEKIKTPNPCPWEEHTEKSRGMKQLSILLRAETEDNLEDGFAGSGSYRCYHTMNAYGAAQVKVYVAGTLLEIKVNGTKMDGEIYEMPVEPSQGPLTLKCVIAAGAKRLLPDKKIEWYRNEKDHFYPSERFTFSGDMRQSLQIDQPSRADGGVYMCVAELEQQNGKPITSRQYVVLQGDSSGVRSAISNWLHFAFYYGAIIFLTKSSIR